jgi:hypothetical protein
LLWPVLRQKEQRRWEGTTEAIGRKIGRKIDWKTAWKISDYTTPQRKKLAPDASIFSEADGSKTIEELM